MDAKVEQEIIELTEYVMRLLAEHGLKILGAVVVLAVGWKVINKLSTIFDISLKRLKVEPSLATFFSSFGLWLFRVLLLLSVAAMIGVQTTSFLAVLGSAGLAIGLALQGSLANLAGGVLILMLRPFKVGDFIETGSTMGTVKQILLFHTELTTTDNRLIIMPNGALANANIINYSFEPTRRMDFEVGIAYSDDIKKAREVMMSVAVADERVLLDPAPQVLVASLGDSSVNMRLRLWVATSNYWPLLFYLNEEVKIALDQNGLNIPFPQRDVHLYQVSPESK
jgi:small conductance mechanosensitive channel